MPEVASERRVAELEEQLATMRAQVRRIEMSIDVWFFSTSSEGALSHTSSPPLSSLRTLPLTLQAEAEDINAQQAASVS